MCMSVTLLFSFVQDEKRVHSNQRVKIVQGDGKSKGKPLSYMSKRDESKI